MGLGRGGRGGGGDGSLSETEMEPSIESDVDWDEKRREWGGGGCSDRRGDRSMEMGSGWGLERWGGGGGRLDGLTSALQRCGHDLPFTVAIVGPR